MTNAILIRPAANEDVPAILDIHESIIPPEEGELAEEDLRQRMLQLGEKEGYWMIEQAGDPIGWGLIQLYSPRGGYRFCAELKVCVLPVARRESLGASLLDKLVDQCRFWGYHHLLARIWGDDEAGLKLYRAAGFEVVGRQKEIGRREERWVDMVVFQMILPVADQ